MNAGKDYDLTGMQIRIRNTPAGKRLVKNEQSKVISKKVIVRNNNGKKPTKQQVNRVLVKDNGEKPSIRKQQRSFDIRSTKAKSVVKADKKVKRPAIIERINRHEQSKHVRNTPQKPAVKNNDLKHKRENKQEKRWRSRYRYQIYGFDHCSNGLTIYVGWNQTLFLSLNYN